MPAICLGALYTPTSTSLDAATGKTGWEGPDDQLNLGSQMGTHSASSNYSYFSGWSLSNVDSSASASAMLCGSLITLSAFNSTNGSGYDHTQAIGSASVSFDLPGGEYISLSDSATYTDSAQVSLSLTGPDGWTWPAPLDTPILAPAGEYTFSISASVERMAGMDFASSENASLQFAPGAANSAVVPEPTATLFLVFAPWTLSRKRQS